MEALNVEVEVGRSVESIDRIDRSITMPRCTSRSRSLEAEEVVERVATPKLVAFKGLEVRLAREGLEEPLQRLSRGSKVSSRDIKGRQATSSDIKVSRDIKRHQGTSS